MVETFTQTRLVGLLPDLLAVPKMDPVFLGTRFHFEDMMERYGSPLLVLNLVKKVNSWLRLLLLVSSVRV